MRDYIREKDIEQRLDITVGEVTVDVADNGTAVITLKRDHLDALFGTDCSHEDCIDVDDHEDAVVDARLSGESKGYDRAIADVRSLASGSAA